MAICFEKPVMYFVQIKDFLLICQLNENKEIILLELTHQVAKEIL